MKAKKILFLASGLEGASCRFRVLQYLPYLREMGLQVDVADLAVPAEERRKVFESAAGYDRVVVHRTFLRFLDYQRFRRAVKSYVYDFDDALMFRDSSHRKFNSWQRLLRFKRMVSGARAVIAGNTYLAHWAGLYNKHVTIIPTAIELKDYPAGNPGGGPEPIIGWIGTRVNLMYLETIIPALSRAGQNALRPKLKIVSDGFLDVPGMEVIKKNWSLKDEPADVRSFQIGIMPLPNDPWTRGKCALKLLQYMAASVPVVCSPVGANIDVVEDGKSGYFATTEDEWVERLEELLADPEKRRRFGQAGRETVEKKYSVQGNVERLVETII
ncbi:MAG: glycosyltransferase family 4 protein [Armatimonadota bacterium]|nr:glycosyltransferase family 4 protein [Armatimonadota bacterium]